jgi:hypothetical protein
MIYETHVFIVRIMFAHASMLYSLLRKLYTCTFSKRHVYSKQVDVKVLYILYDKQECVYLYKAVKH